MPDQFLRLDTITHSYGAMVRAVVEEVSLAVGRNEFFSLLGPSGCGKTTLLRLIAGFEAPTKGRILLGGQDISNLPPWRRAVNTVFQSYALFPHLTVIDNVAFGLRMRGIGRQDRRARASEALDLTRMADFADRPIRALSGGQQQRVALARALACRPDILLLDEPLSALDARLRREMQLELKRLQRESGTTFVFVTHDQEEAMSMSDRLAVMGGGKILQVGAPTEVYDTPASREVAEFIGESNVLTAVPGLGGMLRGPGGLALDLPGSAACSVLVRPEDLALDPTGVPARIIGRQFSGGGSLLHLDLDGVTLLSRSADPSRRDLAIGASVCLAVRRAKVLQ